jgi:hypothetical protein
MIWGSVILPILFFGLGGSGRFEVTQKRKIVFIFDAAQLKLDESMAAV